MADIIEPDPSDVTYFDEAYFERGWERGTAYANYKESAGTSLIFRGVASALKEVFEPGNALEIGCATGAIVRQMNFYGISTDGIDVSEWAVKNALHPKVQQASAANLPFADSSFDLVYSSHALEHLPLDIYQAAFREIDRVCQPDAVQFHMLPIVGTYPYDYDEATAIANLKADPTHVLLKNMNWWLEQWDKLGWEPISPAIFFAHDTDNIELSSGQFCLTRRNSGRRNKIEKAIKDWNAQVFRTVSMSRHQVANADDPDLRLIGRNPALLPPMLGPSSGIWDDFKCHFAEPVNLENARLKGVISLESATPIAMRIALIADSGGVLEKWLEIPPGHSLLDVGVDKFGSLEGNGSVSAIRSIYFGGTIREFNISANLAAYGPNVAMDSLFT